MPPKKRVPTGKMTAAARRKLEREVAAFFAVPDPDERKEREAYAKATAKAITHD